MKESILKGKKILIVDDDRDVTATMYIWFDNLGAITETASDGNSAIEKTNKENYDIIILDMILPGRSGFMVTHKVKKSQKAVERPVIIMITGNTGKRHKMYAQTIGVAEYLLKPIKMEVLQDHCERLIAAVERIERKTFQNDNQLS